jgi:hypothetical protein
MVIWTLDLERHPHREVSRIGKIPPSSLERPFAAASPAYRSPGGSWKNRNAIGNGISSRFLTDVSVVSAGFKSRAWLPFCQATRAYLRTISTPSSLHFSNKKGHFYVLACAGWMRRICFPPLTPVILIKRLTGSRAGCPVGTSVGEGSLAVHGLFRGNNSPSPPQREYDAMMSRPPTRPMNLRSSPASFSHTFGAIGEFEYFCSLHPHMKAKIIVKAP